MRLKNTRNIIAPISISSALREQIKRLEDTGNGNERSDNESSDHDTSEQNQPASTRYYRSSNSVDGEAITPSKAHRNNDYRERSRYLHSDTPSRPLGNIDNRRERHSATTISIRSSSEESTESSSKDSGQEKRISKYLYSTDMPKDLYDALRRQIIWIMKMVPPDKQLELNRTYEQQHDLINSMIILTVMNALDQNTFPIIKGIVYEILHKLHRHRCEDYLMKKKSTSEQNEHNRRKHRNSRQSEKRKRRAKMIEKLQEMKDPLIGKFSKRELRPFKIDNRYHSPEDSETDQSSHPGDRIIVTKDLKWCSDTCRRFLREYVDKIFDESSKVPCHRNRTCGRSYAPNEGMAPLNAPKWSVSGYSGSLKKEVDKFIRVRSSYIGNNSIDNNDTINN
ncbi:hypothetical protein RhiirA4_477194 [Rhizophagus irregularis]|uniref:Uncharacterized protein n=1 Tax=Rhizophagus irregularis TaxID=588596 RepID=A0A2I1HCV5_9GLOM|nr:hypothetical protein RhiirA4_477194 [Rhizophagus irregularis]